MNGVSGHNSAGREQPRLMRWILAWIITLVQDRLLTRLTCSPAHSHCAMTAPLWCMIYPRTLIKTTHLEAKVVVVEVSVIHDCRVQPIGVFHDDIVVGLWNHWRVFPSFGVNVVVHVSHHLWKVREMMLHDNGHNYIHRCHLEMKWMV